MLRNRINLEDLAVSHRALRRLAPARKRVAEAWAHVEEPPVHAWDVPAVVRRRNRLATGDETVAHFEYLADRYLVGATVSALSVGSGTGWRELEWAQTGRFARILGLDLAPERVEAANRAAADAKLAEVVRFEVADVFAVAFAVDDFDIVIFEDALHHLAPIDAILDRVCRLG